MTYEIKRCSLLGRKAMTNLDSILKRYYFADKGLYSQSYSSHVWMWELDHKEEWELKNLCFWTVILEKTLESPLAWKEIKPVNPKGNQSWILIGRTDAEAGASILWPPDVGKDWGQEKGKTENEMIGWHHQLNGYEFEKILRDSEGQGSLVYCSPWGPTESDTT